MDQTNGAPRLAANPPGGRNAAPPCRHDRIRPGRLKQVTRFSYKTEQGGPEKHVRQGALPIEAELLALQPISEPIRERENLRIVAGTTPEKRPNRAPSSLSWWTSMTDRERSWTSRPGFRRIPESKDYRIVHPGQAHWRRRPRPSDYLQKKRDYFVETFISVAGGKEPTSRRGVDILAAFPRGEPFPDVGRQRKEPPAPLVPTPRVAVRDHDLLGARISADALLDVAARRMGLPRRTPARGAAKVAGAPAARRGRAAPGQPASHPCRGRCTCPCFAA
jgi:hypothetical protein